MRVALDSNILIYAEGGNDARRQAASHRIIAGVLPSQILLPIQSLAETLSWLVRKGGVERSRAMQQVSWWISQFPVQDTDIPVLDAAIELCVSHHLQVFDSIILSAASIGGASVLLSEDMHDGFKWRGVTVVNPFSTTPHPLVKAILSQKE
jgi:predicted nucleic acid-binding protein